MIDGGVVRERSTLADQASSRLRAWILSGQVADRRPLSEVALAERLGVSRTPLRSAIQRLCHEGLLEVRDTRIHVVPFSKALVREVYPIIGALEAMALRLSAPGALPSVRELEDLNDQMVRDTPKPRLYELDQQFHRLLTAGCPNERLLKMLEAQRTLAMRIDGSTDRGLHGPEWSHEQHDRIISAIADRRVLDASRLIEDHFVAGMEIVIDWLTQRDARTAGGSR